jgi:X-Pro dipeptidyl-peptidase
MAAKIRAAVFHVHGTLDENVKDDHFAAMWRALERNHVTRKALIGPWMHGEPAVPWWHLTALRWYEHWLHGNDTGMMDEPTLTLIDQDGVRRTSTAYPPIDAKVMRLAAGSGVLGAAAPVANESYTDIPGLPRQAIRSTVGARLIYTSDALRTPVRLSGTPTFDIVASIDRTDTNFAVHLFDLADGRPTYVTRGYLDARHRATLDWSEDVVPGRPERYSVELHAREYVFAAGHSIEVVLSSSDSCQWQVGVQGDPVSCKSSGIVSDPVPARVTVYEATGRTQLRLPIAPLVDWPRPLDLGLL